MCVAEGEEPEQAYSSRASLEENPIRVICIQIESATLAPSELHPEISGRRMRGRKE